MPTVGVRIEQVNLSYGDNHVLKSIDLDIQPGEFFAFLGPSGCGKTTLLRLIAGFGHADRGRVLVGERGHHRPAAVEARHRHGVPELRAVAAHDGGAQRRLRARGAARAARRDRPRVAAALELVGLTGLDQRRPAQLSGGQQQRVALARTIAIEPKVLLLDEPLSNLDAKLRVQVRRELRELQQRLGITTIFVTHDQEEANTICDRIAVMNDGVIQQIGTPMDLYDQPANLFVANFLGTANILEGRITGDGAERAFVLASGGRLPMPATAFAPDGARLVFRPQHAVLHPPGAGGLAGAIRHREFLGATVRYGVGIGTDEILVDAPFSTRSETARNRRSSVGGTHNTTTVVSLEVSCTGSDLGVEVRSGAG